MLNPQDPVKNDLALHEVLNYLGKGYDLGVSLKQMSIKDFEAYSKGIYVQKGPVLIADGVPINRKPPINSRYNAWFDNVILLLGSSPIPNTPKATFRDTRTLFDLDLARDDYEIVKAYDHSLDSLKNIIENIERYNSKVTKTISLRLVNNFICLHIEQDNEDVRIHKLHPDSPLKQEFEYFLVNQNRKIVASELALHGQGSNAARDLSEDLRAMKLNKLLKGLFFPESHKDWLIFVDHTTIKANELEVVLSGL